jgi:hypothetical protein
MSVARLVWVASVVRLTPRLRTGLELAGKPRYRHKVEVSGLVVMPRQGGRYRRVAPSPGALKPQRALRLAALLQQAVLLPLVESLQQAEQQ